MGIASRTRLCIALRRHVAAGGLGLGALLALLTGCGSTPATGASGGATPLAIGTASAAPTASSSGTVSVATTSTSPAGSACDLVTQDEASSALGAPAGPPRSTPNGETCVYMSGTSALVVKIAPAAEITGHDPVRALLAISQQHGGHSTGGGATVVYDDARQGKSVAFVKHDALVIIGITGHSVSESALVNLATSAESRY